MTGGLWTCILLCAYAGVLGAPKPDDLAMTGAEGTLCADMTYNKGKVLMVCSSSTSKTCTVAFASPQTGGCKQFCDNNSWNCNGGWQYAKGSTDYCTINTPDRGCPASSSFFSIFSRGICQCESPSQAGLIIGLVVLSCWTLACAGSALSTFRCFHPKTAPESSPLLTGTDPTEITLIPANRSRPGEGGCCGFRLRPWLLVGTALQFVGVVLLLVGSANKKEYQLDGSTEYLGFMLTGGIGLGAGWFGALMCSCSSSVYEALADSWQDIDIDGILTRLVQVCPGIHVTAESYHYETRTRTVTKTRYVNGKSETYTTTETYQERVDTHSENKTMDYKKSVDSTRRPPLSILKSAKYIRLELHKEWRAGNTATTNAFQSLKHDLHERNKHRDTHISITTGMGMGDYYREDLMAVNGSKHFLFHPRWRWIVSILGLGWPYLWWVDSKCLHGHINVIKTLYV